MFPATRWGDDGRPTHLKGEYVPDEEEQAAYLRELLVVFEGEGIDAAFDALADYYRR